MGLAPDQPSTATSEILEKAEADRVNLLEEFIAILGHDLTSPLSAIRMSAELLAQGVSGEPDGLPAKHVRRILLASESMQRMIQDLLDLARSRRGGGFVLQRSPCDLNDVVRRVVDEARLLHPGRRIILEAAAHGVGAWDAVRLSQAMSNLVLNAIVHSPPDSPVRVSTRNHTGGGVTLEVNNQGAIAADALPGLFQPFRRRAGSSGLGLGLYIAQQIVQAHGGRLEAHSSEAEGTTLIVRL
jgi:sigma-B regulation protein RsbU (phosphoserine phosphatase)